MARGCNDRHRLLRFLGIVGQMGVAPPPPSGVASLTLRHGGRVAVLLAQGEGSASRAESAQHEVGRGESVPPPKLVLLVVGP
jgi:hypothetical protein